MGELHLGLEVADGAQAADDRAGAPGAAEVDGQAVERLDLDPIGRRVGLGEGLADDPDPRLDIEQRRLPRVGQDGHDDACRTPSRHGSMMSRWPFVIGSNEPG